MFTGIVESVGQVLRIDQVGSNKSFQVKSPISHELKVDQSLSHDGICLTVTRIEEDTHWVTAVKETLQISHLDLIEVGYHFNLERSLRLSDRLDGHLVQGHIDAVGRCVHIEPEAGSWRCAFSFPVEFTDLLVFKGSICINGISLTIATLDETKFEVAIIPYTWDHTNMSKLSVGDAVNLEFDLIGKYIKSMLKKRAIPG